MLTSAIVVSVVRVVNLLVDMGVEPTGGWERPSMRTGLAFAEGGSWNGYRAALCERD